MTNLVLRGNFLSHKNGVFLGELLMMEDGFWQWFPAQRPGYIPSTTLREIADIVDARNKDWEATIQKELGD